MKFMHDIQRQCHGTAVEKGWWPFKETKIVEKNGVHVNTDFMVIDTDRVNIPEKLMLMVSEISEAMEHARQPDFNPFIPMIMTGEKNDKPDGLWVELADCMIRIFDLAGAYGIDMETVLDKKMEYNRHRSYRHGGKKF